MGQEQQVEVKLLKYVFQFRGIKWREHASIPFTKGKDHQRLLLAYALLTVAGIKPKNVEEATRVMDAIPAAIVDRVFKIWRASFPPARKFTTSKLYCAPKPSQYSKQIELDDEEEDVVHDKTMREMESKFGHQELAETRELERKILAASQRKEGGYLGAVVATEDKHD